MADDIDIEEHDVLESLRRRRAPDAAPDMAPDAAPDGAVVVKSEPLDTDYEESNYEDHGNSEYQWEWDKNQAPEIKVEPYAEEEFRFGKIILGSKPAEAQGIENAPEVSQDGQENYNYNMSLVLDDWGPMLERSDCYCKACQTLFATVNALDAHKMIAHSFLVATDKQPSPDRNKAVKSTAKPSNNDDRQTCQICQFHFQGTNGKFNLNRHYRQVHQVDPNSLGPNKDFKNWRICNHCNMYFPDDTSLVKHLYELLPISNKTPTKNDMKAGQSGVKAKPVLNIDKSNKDIKSTNVKSANFKNPKVNDNTPIPNRIILGSKPQKNNITNNTESESIPNEPKPKIWKCQICETQYHRKYYLIHMKKLHPHVLIKRLKKTNTKIPEKIILNNTRIKYKCNVCQEVLTSSYAVKKHRVKHAHTKGERIISKIIKVNKTHKVNVRPNLIKKEPVKVYASKTPAKVYPSKTPVKVYPSKTPVKVNVKEPMEENEGILVSKSTLFKCNRCSVHFLTCTGACQHSIVCETSSNIRDWACPKCQRVFKSAEKSAHEYQHQMMNANKFKVYVVYLEMIVRVLCECPDCFVCFEEDKFLRHVSGGCRDAASYYCNECKLPIDIHSKTNHESKHKHGDFKKDDFIKIDYVSSKKKKIKTEFAEELNSVNERKGLKRKLDISDPQGEQKKRARIHDDLNLHYCSACKTYLGRKQAYHISGHCKQSKKKQRCLCKICGILLKETYFKSHMGLHGKFPNLSLFDFTFTRMTDSKKMRPLTELFPCKVCKVNFFTKGSRKNHKCGHTPSANCQVCQKNIQKDVFKLHMQIHNYVIPSKVKSINDMTSVAGPSQVSRKDTKSPMTQNFTRKETKSPMTKLPDLLMKYQSLTALWNILYLCGTCDTFTDSYDKVVEHCQNHLTNMENYGVVIKKCQICDMKFDSECYKRHLELHAGSKVINKKTFQILKYDYGNLFSDQWFDFIDLPEEQKSQIVDRSIYGATRCVKMRLIQQGPPEYTLYKCNKCLNCVATDTIVYHVKLSNCLKAHKIGCSVCNMTFAIRSQCTEHEQIHQTTGLGLQSFRIVAFNDADDAENNSKIMSYDAENHGSSKNRISFTDDETPKTTELSQNNANGKSKSFVLYKCAECETCILHIHNFANHNCDKSRPKRECDKCGLNINVKYFPTHKKLHEKYAFSRKNVITKTLNKDGKVINIKKQSQEKPGNQQTLATAAQTSNLYKCYCGLHYTSLKSIEKHYKMKNCSTVIREKCSQCNLVFDPIEVVNHLCKHHAQKHVMSFNIVTPNKKTLYKCSLCHVLFYNKAAAMLHKGKCGGKFCGKKCEKCGLAFDATSIDTHMVDHERNNKLRTDCYVTVKIPDVITGETDRKSDKEISPNLLFKCKICDIHFLRRSTARNHTVKSSNCNLTKTTKCKLCNLRFPNKSMPKHLGWQHNIMKVKKFHVVEVIPGVNTKLPKSYLNEEIIVESKVMKQVEKSKVEVESRVMPKTVLVNVQVYRCIKCRVHFTDENSLVNHLEDRCSKDLTEECEDCAVKFASRNIKEHKKHHGPNISLTMDIIDDVTLPPIRDAKKEKPRVYERRSKDYSLDRYDNKLYRCTKCNHLYNRYNTLTTRHEDYCHPGEIGLRCDVCDIGYFTKISLRRHELVHKKYNFTKDDFLVLTLSDVQASKVVNKSNPGDIESEQEIEQDTETEVTLDSSSELDLTEISDPGVSKEPTSNSISSELELTKKSDTGVSKEPTSNSISSELDLTKKSDTGVSKEPKKEPTSNSIVQHNLFKCAECNVYFGTQKTVLKHVTKHTPFDPKEYIECKLCGFQFTIMGLQPHIKKLHEKPLNLETVLVEEYQPNDIKASETYFASEKDQSRLVSTSDDVKNVSNSKEENDCEVTSCNEIAEKVDSTDDGQVNTDITDVVDDKTKSDQSTNDLKEITDPSVSGVPSSDNVNNGKDTE